MYLELYCKAWYTIPVANLILAVAAAEIGSLAGSSNDAANQRCRAVYAATSQGNNGEIVNASKLLASIDEDMKNVGVSTEETFTAISAMKEDLDTYQKDWR